MKPPNPICIDPIPEPHHFDLIWSVPINLDFLHTHPWMGPPADWSPFYNRFCPFKPPLQKVRSLAPQKSFPNALEVEEAIIDRSDHFSDHLSRLPSSFLLRGDRWPIQCAQGKILSNKWVFQRVLWWIFAFFMGLTRRAFQKSFMKLPLLIIDHFWPKWSINDRLWSLNRSLKF